MSVTIVTGSAGLVGSEAAPHCAKLGWHVIGIDNDMRARFFGEEASTRWVRDRLQRQLKNYLHRDIDIRDEEQVFRIFQGFGTDIGLVIHAAAQPSHDWAATNPKVDLAVNATGTSVMLEATRRFAPDAVFIYMSTNKVYGDAPNFLPLVEHETRWEIAPEHAYHDGIPESMSVDHTMHSLFGVSKLAADLLVQEYGRYFGMRTACFRGGCLTGPNHSGTELHGFLAFLVKTAMRGKVYTIFGYKGKQVRDQIHSIDVVRAFEAFVAAPRVGEVYNLGGGRESNASILECFQMIEATSGCKVAWRYDDGNRAGDHICYISNISKFRSHYPEWSLTRRVDDMIDEVVSLEDQHGDRSR